MTRNTEHRVEISCPIEDIKCREKIEHILDTIIKDNVKARELNPDKKYTRCCQKEGEQLINSQETFMLEAGK